MLQVLRCLGVEIWDFLRDNRQTDRQTDYFTPAHVRGVNLLAVQ